MIERSMRKLRVGIVGAGWAAENRHLPAFGAMDDVEVATVWSRDPEKARSAAARFGIGRVANEWQDVVGAPDVGAVVIATPPVLHLPATLAALNAGKHVLCQARMARNAAEARLMVEAARQSKLVTALYPPRPGLKGDRVMRRLIRDGFVGEIREVRVTGVTLDAPGDRYIWASDPAVAGVNAMTLGMWAEVCNRWVGPALRVAAIARTHRAQRIGADGAPTGAVVPDSLAVTAELACGATASYHLSTCAAFGPGHSIEIFGSRGALVYRLFAEEIQGATAGDPALHAFPILPDEERTQTTDAEFVQAIRSGGFVSPSFEEGLGYMEFCEAVALAVKTGATVPVPSGGAVDSWEDVVPRSFGMHR